ncbi:hypothetical protein [Thiohalomonas denitrificans]|uniref:hypothetical protein n=1 Tax=Thiohalomonas denitrificans TaxID=415747 RepID=UPI0026EC4EE2|nr:hypothetical protein [Thiohalomonas denitrificans]
MAAANIRRILTRLSIGLTIAAPVGLHLLIIFGYARTGLGLVALVALLHASRGLMSHRFITAAVATAVVGLCSYGMVNGDYEALYLPPILVSLSLLILFGRSLQAGAEPIVTRFARILMNETDPDTQRYTRQVTRVWTLFFALMLIESILLAVYAPLAVWSLFANVLNYLFIAGVFAIELTVRLIRFRHHSAVRFFRALYRVDPQSLSGRGGEP